jgi:hypothetical protein
LNSIGNKKKCIKKLEKEWLTMERYERLSKDREEHRLEIEVIKQFMKCVQRWRKEL